jgi:flavin-dependent dehydrogenase
VIYDLAVAGAGPIGLGTAIEAATAGLSVVVLDPRGGPIDKACGEGLMPAARVALSRLGVEPEGLAFRGIRYQAGGSTAEAVFVAGPGLGVRRTTLSAALDRRAAEVGVHRVTGKATAPVVRDAAVSSGGVRARWLVAADGLHSPIRRSVGLDPVPAARRGTGRPPRYGLRRHYRVEPWSDLVEVHWARDAEAYVTPVAPDLVGVAVLGPGGSPYQAWLDRFPLLRNRLAGAEPVGEVRGAGPLRQRVPGRVAGRTLLVGDAAGYVDALTGEGISIGLACAQALVGCLLAGRPDDYEAAWTRATRQYRLSTSALLWAAGRPALRRAIVPAASRLPVVFAGIVNRLG